MKREIIEQHERFLWAFFTVIFLGFWLVCSPEVFGYESEAMKYSDRITGAVIIFFGLLSLSPRMILAPWVLTFAGIWLEMAPLLFWAPDSASYLNDTLVGVLVVALALLLPGIPGVLEQKGLALPFGWSYNPSSWGQRLPVIVCGTIGWFIARYLAAFQLGYTTHVWDPFFGMDTERVLNSSVAKFFPVSDAGLGAFAYTLEVLMGLKGGVNRWRTMPWMVVTFGLLVVPLGVVSVLLITLQPILVHAWCSLCLIAGFCMLIMIIFTIDEMVAVLQFLYLAKKKGLPFWKTFFCGGSFPGLQEEIPTPLFRGIFRGATLRWNLALSTAIGVYLMFTPLFLMGALVIVVSMISFAEVARTLRFCNVLLGLILLFGLNWVGILLIILAYPKGKIRESYGAWSIK